jgi:catechol 2,3-dioxygenase-like lactoylglutathione lyase family enzyme
MKCLHVHVSVKDLDASVRFYSQLFATDPTLHKSDYAKWMLEDLGIQVEDRAELAEVYERLRRAQGPVIEEGETTCCYARSEKSWIDDPQGVQWETFLTTGESTAYGTDEIRPKAERRAETARGAPGCCSSNPAEVR